MTEAYTHLNVRKMEADATLPTRAHADDAGLDLYAFEDAIFEPGQSRMVRTGVAMAIAPGHVGLVADRSSLAKRGLKTAGGVIDAGYRGEVQVVMLNLSGTAQKVARGERVAQLLILPIATPAVREVTDLGETSRGTGGFGSSGR